VEIRLYSSSYALVSRTRLQGPYGAGWQVFPVDSPELPNGIYFYTLEIIRGDERQRSGVGRAFVAH
jgi:hypothetical protein